MTRRARAEPPGDDDEWLRPSPKLRTVRRLEVAAATVPVVIVAGVVTGLLVGLGFALLAAALAVVAGLVLDWFVARRVSAWAYRERADDLLVRRGVMVRRLSVVPYGRMQFVDVTAGPFERPFGLATVRMHTAAAATDARIPGLTGPDAARLRDQLARLGEAQAAGL